MPYQQPQRGMLEPEMNIALLHLVNHRSEETRHTRYVHFGALLQSLRDRVGYTQEQFVEALAPAFREAHVPELGVKTYGNLERDERYPHFQELWPLLRGLVECCHIKLAVQDGRDFYEMARRKIDSSKKWRRPEADWHKLEQRVAAYIDAHEEHSSEYSEKQQNNRKLLLATDFHEWERASNQHGKSAFAEEAGSEAVVASAPEPTFTLADVRHILGRDAWLKEMLSYLHMAPPKKLVIIQGLTGTGKTSGLKLLAHHMVAVEEYHIFPIYRLKPASDRTPQDHLDVFLAELFKDLSEPRPQEDAKILPLEQRIQLIFKKLQEHTQPLVLLLDDLQMALEPNGALAPGWQQWFTSFVEAPHKASLFIATRQWSWSAREYSYLIETRMEQLPSEIGAELFKRFGFSDVPDELLQRASRKCGGNPHLIELRAASLMRPHYSFSWDDDKGTIAEQRQDNTQRIEDFVKESHVFAEADIKADVEAQHLLEQVMNAHLSPDALRLLEVLSTSVMPLALPLLKLASDKVEFSFAQLQRAAFIDEGELQARRAQLLPLVREAGWQHLLAQDRVQKAESLLAEIYQLWLSAGSFRSEREKGDVVAEVAVLLLKQRRLLEAAQLWIRFGWLAANQSHGPRVARLARQMSQEKADSDTTLENTCGMLLLRYLLSPYLGSAIDTTRRAEDYQYIHDLALAGKVQLDATTDLHVIHHRMSAAIGQSRYQDAQKVLDEYSQRAESYLVSNAELQASLLERYGWLYTTWCEYAEEHEDLQTAHNLREKAIAIYQQCSELLTQSEAQFPLQKSQFQKRLARCYNNVGYHLNRSGQFGEALASIEKSLALKEQGNTQVGSLAASYSEKSIALAGLGRFQEALSYDKKANEDIEYHAQSGYKLSQEDKWMYTVNRGRLYLRLGKIDEAEQLLQEALEHIPHRRNWYHMLAKEALQEMKEWRYANKASHYQIDWHWVDRFRSLASYDSYWWLAHAGPFTDEERQQWNHLIKKGINDQTKEQLSQLLSQSRERELAASLAEQREPHLQYPAIEIEEVRTRIAGLLRLDDNIQCKEANAIVRRLYHETIEEELWYLRMIEASYEHSNEYFQHYNLLLNSPPTPEEMEYALSCVNAMVRQGFTQPETREVSERVAQFIHGRLRLPRDRVSYTHQKTVSTATSRSSQRASMQTEQYIPVQMAKRFFDASFQQSGFEGWQTVIDPNESGARVEQGLRQFFIPDKPLSLGKVRHYLSHELAGHVARCVAGERSILGLLGIHTRNSLLTEEGLAIYHDRQMAALLGQPYDDSATWIGTLAVGLASGVIVPPQTFLALHTFFEQFLLLRRLLKGQDSDFVTAQQQARRLATVRCLRTFRGVPDLKQEGIFYGKDAFYLRGLWKIEQEVAQDETILDRLGVGVVAVEQLPDLRELEIVNVTQSLWKLAQDPHLEEYIFSFNQPEERLDSVNGGSDWRS